jgi:hypothetical protein
MSSISRIVVTLGLLLFVSYSTLAADRAVLIEHFHATW